MIVEAVWKGFLTGLWLSMSFGPVFFILIQTSIKKGIKGAVVFDTGVLLSDIFYITIAFFGAEIILENDSYRYWIALIGGLLLIVFGVIPFFNPKKKASTPNLDDLSIVTRLNYSGLIAKGFLINLLNPSVLFIWFGAATVAFATFADKKSFVLLYFAATLITYFGIDLAKVYLAHKLKRFLNPAALLLINRISGFIILVFGVYLIVDLFFLK
jgi:threonine/homoserine/homoserine lactone efflux protein